MMSSGPNSCDWFFSLISPCTTRFPISQSLPFAPRSGLSSGGKKQQASHGAGLRWRRSRRIVVTIGRVLADVVTRLLRIDDGKIHTIEIRVKLNGPRGLDKIAT